MSCNLVSEAVRRARGGFKMKIDNCFLYIMDQLELVKLNYKALAEYIYNDEQAIVRLDMSEYMESHKQVNYWFTTRI